MPCLIFSDLFYFVPVHSSQLIDITKSAFRHVFGLTLLELRCEQYYHAVKKDLY